MATKRIGSVGLTDESRENYLSSLALDLAEKQLQDGSASPIVIAHFLRQGSPRAQLEREKLKQENALLAAKTAAIESAGNEEEMYKNAVEAMRRYSRTSDELV